MGPFALAPGGAAAPHGGARSNVRLFEADIGQRQWFFALTDRRGSPDHAAGDKLIRRLRRRVNENALMGRQIHRKSIAVRDGCAANGDRSRSYVTFCSKVEDDAVRLDLEVPIIERRVAAAVQNEVTRIKADILRFEFDRGMHDCGPGDLAANGAKRNEERRRCDCEAPQPAARQC